MGGGSSKGSGKKPVGQSGPNAPSSLAIAATSLPRDWNDEFQRALDMLDAEDFVQGYAQLAAVCSDFQSKALALNDVIISELGIVDEEKTYLSSSYYSAGPGFTMYEASNIIRKVAHGGQGAPEWMELGNEFRASTQFLRCRLHSHDKCSAHIAVPLMCLIDYKGFRTLLLGKLPRRDKLIIGWDPVLKGFVLDNAEVRQGIQRAGKMLGLAFHSLGMGTLAVQTNVHADVNCWQEFLPMTVYRRRRCYMTNLKNLFPADLSRGASVNVDTDELPPDVHVEMPEKLRPEMVRRNATVTKNGGLSADVGLAPPRANPLAKYVHDGADESLADLKRAIMNLTRLQTLETVDNISKVLKENSHEEKKQTEKAPSKSGKVQHESTPARLEHEKMALITTTLHAEGLNLRFLGHLRSKVKAHSHDQFHGEIRRLVLHEMVARILKISVYKILREANGMKGGEEGAFLDAVKQQLGIGGDARDRNVKKSDQIPSLEDLKNRRKLGRRVPSNETCRTALVNFFNVIFARQFLPLKEPAFVEELESNGADPDKVKEVAKMATMIQELRKKNKTDHPGAMDQAIAALKKELLILMDATGGQWLVDKVKAKLKQNEDDDVVADVLLREALPDDSFSIYWRETMRMLIRRKYGNNALASAEMARDWTIIDNIDLSAVFMRLQELTNIKFHQAAHDKIKLINYCPPDPYSAVKFSEGDLETLGPSIKDNGLAAAGRGWSLMYKGRALALGAPKEQLLQLAVSSFKDQVQRNPNDWVANYNCGCALYDLAWASPPSTRYEIMRSAYWRFRHSHKVCPTWLASMLRLGDTVYSMTLMRQDTGIEEDYVNLCVAASDLLDHSLDYSARCGVWANQVYNVAAITNGYRSQRLFTLAGVTYNEWIGLGGDPEAVSMKWLLDHHKQMDIEPADIAAMVNLIRETTPSEKGNMLNLKRLTGAAMKSKNANAEVQSLAQFERIYFTNCHVSNACVVLVSTRAPVGSVKHLDLSNTDNLTDDALLALCEEHGESLESLVLSTTPKISLPAIIQSVSLCHAEGFGQLQKLHLDDIKELGDVLLQKMSAKLPKHLTSLSLQYCLNVEDAGIISIAKTQTNLLHLNLCGCDKITDASVLYIAHACIELQSINLMGCHFLTNEGLVQFAYRTRRYYTGRKGIVGKGPYNHDDPTLVLADLVLKNRGKKKKEGDEDDDWVFDEDIALSEDPEAMAAFEAERARKDRVKALRLEIQEKEFTKTLKAARLTLDQVQAIFSKGDSKGDDNVDPDKKLIDLDEIAVRMGLEEPAARERRLRDAERAKEVNQDKEAMAECERMVAEGQRPWQIARELKLDRAVVMKVKEKWELKNKTFNTLKEVQQEELSKYALQIKMPDCKVKKSVLKDVNPQSRLFWRIQLSSGGAVKNSSYRPVMSDLVFNVDTFIPKIIDKHDFLKLDLCEKPDSGPGKALAYYKAPMPKFIDYPVDMKKVPLYGSAGFFQGQPVGVMNLCIRALSEEEFNNWKKTQGEYDSTKSTASNLASQNKMKEMADQAGVIADKVLDRCCEWAVTQMLDYFDPFKKLNSLNLARCNQLTDFPIIEMVRSMPYITVLNLMGLRCITDKSLEYVGRLCPLLKTFDITGCISVTDDGIAHVSAGCLELECVKIDECADLTDAALAFFTNFDLTNRLKEVTYRGLIRTTEESLSQMASSSTSVTCLALAGNSRYRDVQIISLAQRCHKLRVLDLGWCTGLTDYGISMVAHNCPELQTLSLANCENLTGGSIIEIAVHCPKLSCVDLTGCLRVQDAAILELIKSALQLAWLSISNCELLGKQTLAAITDWGEGLTHLEMLGCSSMSKKDIFHFREKVVGRMEVVTEADDDESMHK